MKKIKFEIILNYFQKVFSKKGTLKGVHFKFSSPMPHLQVIKHYALRFRRGTAGKAHLYLLSKVSWYSRWHRHPHHRKVHYSALALTCLLVCSSIATTLFPNPSGVEAAVATWDFAHDNTKYDYDSSKISMAEGNASLTNPGSATGASTNINAASGTTTNTSASFASANKEYLTIPSNSSLQTGDIDFEIGGWLRLDSIGTVQYINTKVGEYSLFVYSNNKIYFQTRSSGSYKEVISDSFGAVSANTWYFVRAWRNTSSGMAYLSVNGVVDSVSLGITPITTSGAFMFGYNSSSGYLNGRLDSWYFQKRISTTNEATGLYNSGAGRTYNDLTSANGLDTFKTGLTSWWDFNEESGTRYDSKGTNHLTSAADPIIAPPVYGSELIVNPGLETAGAGGADVFGTWQEAVGDGVIADEATLFHGGAHAVKLTGGVTPLSDPTFVQTFAVTAGASYYFSFWSRGDGTNAGRYSITDVTNGYVPIINKTSVQNPTINYQLFTTQFTVPAGCISIGIYLYAPNVTGGIAYFDDVSVKQITTASINNGGFDDRPATGGQSTNISTVSASRTLNVATVVATSHGLKNNDVVTITGFTDTSFNGTGKVVTIIDANTFTYASVGSDTISNLILNPGFETVGGGGADVFANWIESAGDGAITSTTTAGEYRSGTRGIKLVRAYGSTYATSNAITVTPAANYTLTFWTRGDGTHAGQYDVYDNTHSSYIKTTGGTGVTSATYTQVTYSFAAPAGCTSIGVRAIAPASLGGSYAFFDDFSLTQAVTGDTGGRIGTDVFSSWSEAASVLSTVGVNTDTPYAGAYSAKLTLDASASTSQVANSILIDGKSYSYSLVAKAASGTPTLNFKLGSAVNSAKSHTLTTSYATYTGSGFCGGDTALRINSITANAAISLDQVTLTSLGPTADAGIAAGNAIDGNFAAGFTGANYLSKTDTASLRVSSDFEVGAWSFITSGGYILSKGSPSSVGGEYMLWIGSGGGLNFRVRNGDNSGSYTATMTNNSYPLNEWVYVRGWYSSSDQKVYCSINNGAPANAGATSGIYSGTSNLAIGAYPSSYITGRIDGAYKIDRNLSINEATSLYNNGKGLKYASLPDSIKNDSALKGYWNLDEKSGTRYDSTSNGNNLTDNGTVTQVQGVNYYEGTVGTVFDASGNNNTFTQTTLTKRPTYSQSGINNKTTMLFDGVDDGLVATGDKIGTGDVTVTAVINARGLGGASSGRIIDNASGLMIWSDTKINVRTSITTTSAASSIALNTSYVITATRTSAGIVNIYINGALSGTANQDAGTPVAGGDTYIGNNAAFNRAFDGSIGVVQIYNGILDPLHRNDLEKTLGAKYGITVVNDTSASSAVSSLYPTISLNQPLQYATISSFTPTLSGSSTGTPRYQLTTDSTSAAGSGNSASYYYHNGSSWVSANKYNAYQSNTASEIDSNIATLKTDIPSGGANYLKWRAFLITDGIDNPILTSINSNYISDTKAPLNPTTLTSTITPLDSATPQTIANNEWHNSTTLHLTWPNSRNQSEPETDANRGGAIDQINENEIYSGVSSYNLYFGEDPSADPTTTSGLINTNSSPYNQAATTMDLTNLPLESGKTYYFLVETKDLAGNIAHVNQRATEEPPVLDTPLFVYKYDTTAPAQVDYINVSPVGCSTASNFTFTWQPATDTNSGVFGYQYKSSMNGEVKETTETSITVPPYRDDENVFYVRSKDIAGNTTPNWQSAVFCSTGGTYINDGPNTAIDISSFKVDWTSSKPTTSTVTVYDDKDTQTAQVNNETLSLTHQITITGLKPGQDYTYQVSWKDSYNNPGSIEKKAVKTQRISIIDGPTIIAGPSSIEVAWVSSQPTTSYVQVFDGNTYISEQGRTEFVQAHKVTIVGLKPEKTYRYRPLWTDQFGNIDQGEWGETATANTPSVKDLRADVLSPNTVLLSWETNYSANSVVKYGEGESLTKELVLPNEARGFTAKIENLKPGQPYQFRVNASTKDNSDFTAIVTASLPPLPLISALRFEPIKEASHATYKAFWTTNIETSSAIYYKVKGVGGEYKSKASAELTKEHEILLDSMEDQSSYELYAQGSDKYGNVTKSDLNTIKTPNDSRPPKITNLSTSVKSSGFADNQKAQVIVTWDTDELTTSQVEYANGIEGTEYQNRTKEETALSTSHVVVISDLEPSKIYHLRAISKDQANNPAYSQDTTVITGKIQKSVLDIILASLKRSLGWITGLFK